MPIRISYAKCLLLLLTIVGFSTPDAIAQVDPNADRLHLRTNCAGLADCVESTSALTTWLGTRQPSALSPVQVLVGPGEFDALSCGNTAPAYGHVTIRGAGRKRTTFKASGCTLCAAISAWDADCDSLAFQDLRADGSFWGVAWAPAAGSSSWTNVDVIGGRVGWIQLATPCDPLTLARHDIWNAQITAQHPDGFAGNAFEASCADTWIYGSDLVAIVDPNATAGSYANHIAGITAGGVGSAQKGIVHVFGSTVRLLAKTAPLDVVPGAGFAGVQVFQGGEFHMHGGIISVMGNPNHASNVAGLRVTGEGFAHTPDTAFAIAGGTGTTSRVEGKVAESPFIWPPGADPPTAPTDPNNFVRSAQGSDLFVETDCNAAGDCDGDGDEPHLMIQNPLHCGPDDPWFDANTGECRTMGCF